MKNMMTRQTYKKFQCPRCGSNQFEQVPTPPPHYAKLVCAECNAFQRWLPSPQTILEQTFLRETIARLMNAPLTEKERAFIVSISSQEGRLSFKQRAWLESITDKYLKMKGV